MKKSRIIFLIVLILLVTGIGCCFAFYKQNKDSATFLPRTSLNGASVDGKTAKEVSDEIAEQFTDFDIAIIEDEKTVLEGKASEFGYTFDQEAVTKNLEETMAAQKQNPVTMLATLAKGLDLSVEASYDFDEDVFDKKVVSENLTTPRVASSEASIELNKDETAYELKEAVQGNEIDDAQLQSYVMGAIEDAIDNAPVKDTVKIEIPDDVYTSDEVDTDTSALEEEMHTKNQELKLKQTYDKMTVTYEFGSKTQVLDSDTIKSWLSFDDDDNFVVDEDAIASYVSKLAKKYNTIWTNRKFKTHGGKTITIKSGKNMYGYRIIQEDECAQLKEDILAAKPVSREPVYKVKNNYGNPYYLARDGEDDLDGTYVEVDISEQHIWFYKKGKLIVEGDCVTGNTSEDCGTITGIYPLAYKESPSTLTGGDAANGYSTEVKYWMPFNMGQGLHDASWRKKFGGTIYKKNGSHGCVNLPEDVAKEIYENIKAGTAIVVHK